MNNWSIVFLKIKAVLLFVLLFKLNFIHACTGSFLSFKLTGLASAPVAIARLSDHGGGIMIHNLVQMR